MSFEEKTRPGGIIERLFRIDGKVAAVAGGAGRIGRALCRGLADAGAKLCVLDTAADPAAELVNELTSAGHAAIHVAADTTSQHDLAEAVAQITSKLGPPGILVNSTQFRGRGFYGSEVCEHPKEAWDQVIEVNMTGVFLTCQAFGRAMIEHGGGAIVNVSSTYGVVSADPRIYGESGVNSPISYAASKSAILNLTRYLAVHWRDKNIRVNCLVPGGVYDGQADEFVKAYCQRTPLGRMASAEDYVGAVVFMVSPASAYMTGAIVTVDGGWTAW